MGRVEGKVCIITGGAMGLGRADAQALRAEGAIVVVAPTKMWNKGEQPPTRWARISSSTTLPANSNGRR